MPRRRRVGMPGFVYHVLNRANRRDTLFFTQEDFAMFERVLFEAREELEMPLLDYTVMRNHFHLVVQPVLEHQLSKFMHWFTTTHTQRWHSAHQTAGTGSLYQGRYKAFPVQSDRHFLTVVRYVHRNPVRAGLVRQAQDWRWSGAWRLANHRDEGYLDPWPVPRPVDWFALVNGSDSDSDQELARVREATTRSTPFGDEDWAQATATALGVRYTRRRAGRRKTRGVQIDSRPLPEIDSRPLFE